MSSISPYDEALQFIKQNPGTGGAGSLAKLVLSLYNSDCGFSFAECVGNLDYELTSVALRMVNDYASRGVTDDLREAGKIIAEDMYPRLWELTVAMRDARATTRRRWEQEERQAEQDALKAKEAALFTDPSKLIPADKAKEILEQGDPQYAYQFVAGEWRDIKVNRQAVVEAIDLTGGAELSLNCPEAMTLAVRMNERIYYVFTDYEAREAYIESTEGRPKPIPLRVTIPPRHNGS